ncbi:MAG: hypothetical protein M3142_01510, partial [Bacteroidota bacterium]|nr:hypothetical protein [Bacteroidota bacterium]
MAVFFALRHELSKPNRETFRSKANKDVFQNLLKNISLPEIQDFIQRYAAKNKEFKTEFELY